MNVNPKILKRAIDVAIGTAIALEIGIIIIYLGSILLTRQPFSFFDMDGRMTFSTVFQALIILSISLIFFGLAWVPRTPSERPTRRFWLTIAALIFYAGLDELFKLHLGFHSLIPIVGTKYWIVIYSSLIVMVGIGFYRDFKSVWYFSRTCMLIGIAGLAIAIFGAFFWEIFKYILLATPPVLVFPQSHICGVFCG
ncbi:hypothetical protein [Phormidium sp. CCY1219]|uniref:hypothetical protein n=1 Tax=Phormidium sp. CCY1219 TaxID=2886104 RepID=UPI002D1E6C67|nr:hypothetical protein [Phormidium sp. CCY1219]MEB3826725.1 hypothetical protein [Phormidium sp. CCY1219]